MILIRAELTKVHTVHENKAFLENFLLKISQFLKTRLRLLLHPDKILIKTFASGIDFLGWVHFPNHQVLRTATKRRMSKNLQQNQSDETISSYIGFLSYGNTYKLKKRLFAKNIKFGVKAYEKALKDLDFID